MPTNGKYFFLDNDCETSRSYQPLLKSKKKTGGNRAFFRDNCASIWRKTLNRHFFKKMIKSYFFPKFRSVHVNWRKCNDNSATRFQNKQQMITWQLLFIRLFFKYQHHWEDISSYLSPRVCLKNSVNDIFPENQKLIVCWVG